MLRAARQRGYVLHGLVEVRAQEVVRRVDPIGRVREVDHAVVELCRVGHSAVEL
jgi:hypothetical protein